MVRPSQPIAIDSMDWPDLPGDSGSQIYNPVGDLLQDLESGLGEAPIPRISIHAFCVSADTAHLIQTAGQDRRMTRVVLDIQSGGLAAAVSHYQNEPTPSLILVESLDPAAKLMAELDALAHVCDPGTKVVVIGAANDITLYRELIRRGVSEYLTPPLTPIHVIRAISSLYADPTAPFIGRQVAVIGARGGAGASTIAHNLAWTMAERLSTATVLADFDLAFGTAGLNLNQDPLQGIYDALSQPERLDATLMDRMLAKCTDRLSLFAAPATLDRDYDINSDAYDEVSQKIRSTAPFAILDVPSGWSSWKRKLILSTDDLVIVATPDLTSLRNAKNIVDLVRMARPNDVPPRLVLNQIGLPGRPDIPIKDFANALNLTPALVLPFDGKLFGQASNNGQMLGEISLKSKPAEGIEQLARLIARRDPVEQKPASLLARLLGRG